VTSWSLSFSVTITLVRSVIGALLVLLAPALASAQPALSLQEALLRAKPAVALVISEVGGDVAVRCGAGAETTVTPAPFRETGTGWFVASSGWLVTNGHVVSPAHRPPEWLAREQTQKAIQQACGATAGTGRARLEPSISVLIANGVRLPASVVKYSPPVAGEAMSGQDLALLKLEAADMPALPLADSAQARIGDRLHIIGFPGVVLSHELLNSSAKMEASVTGGAISGFKQDRANQPVIQTDAPAAWGNSGGPAVNDAGEVVGVLTFVTLSSDAQADIVQGFNFVIPAAAVVKFLDGTPVPRDERSRFNAAWHSGLRDYFAGNYRRARGKLAEANRLLPELPDVRRLTLENDERLKREPLLPWTWIAVGMLVVSASGWTVLVIRRRQRNRFRIPPAEVMRLIEGPEPPMILDVRASDAYARSPVRIPRSLHVPLDSLANGASTVAADPARVVVAYCT
jgi:S1-C subfamily serine protease